MAKRFYWLKLKNDFFRRPEIAIIEKERRGKEIILLYLKLLLEGIETQGELRLNEKIPYHAESLAAVTHMTPSVVELAMERLQAFGLLTVREDGTLVLPGLSEMIGSETDKAELMRKARKNKKENREGNVVTEGLPACYIEKEIEKETEKEIESELEEDEREEGAVFVQTGQDMTDYRPNLSFDEQVKLSSLMGSDKLVDYLTKMDQFVALKRRPIKDPYGTILKWYQEDQLG